MNASFESKKQHKEHRTSMADSSSAIAYPSRTIVHAKLEMTSPGDLDEQEADAVANEVVSGGKIARKISGGGGSSGIAVSRQMESRLLQLQGGGIPMPRGLRSTMESGFGQDFSQVRLHTDSEADSMSSSIHAKAFTHGNDIYFNRGHFNPETRDGQHLIAHELTHVAQRIGKVGREEKSEKPMENELQEYLSSRFIHFADVVDYPAGPDTDVVFESSPTDYELAIYDDETHKWRVYDEERDGDEVDPKNLRFIVDCDVFANEAISYMENKVYNPNKKAVDKSATRESIKQQDDLYHLRNIEGEYTIEPNQFGFVEKIKTKNGRAFPKELFDPETEYVTGEEIKKRVAAFPSSPTRIGEHNYYPLKFEKHGALLFNYEGAWYVSDNYYVQKLEQPNEGQENGSVPDSIIKQAVQFVHIKHKDANFSYFYFENRKKEIPLEWKTEAESKSVSVGSK